MDCPLTRKITRRAMLQRLGLGATTVYAAPSLLSLTGAAKASSASSGGRSSGGRSSGGRSSGGRSSGGRSAGGGNTGGGNTGGRSTGGGNTGGGNTGGGNTGGGNTGRGNSGSAADRGSGGRSSGRFRFRRRERQQPQRAQPQRAQPQRRTQPRRQTVQQSDPPQARPQPEFVVLLPAGASVGAIEALGYGVLARRGNGVLAGDVLRLRAPLGRTLDEARAEVAATVPVRALDLNALYRPNAMLCDDDSCLAFDMIDWRPGREDCSLPARIGMIDTTVNSDQPALQGQRLTVLEVPREEQRAPASALHGTAIAILLIGRADSGTPGLLPDAELVAVNAFFNAGVDDDAADVYAIAEAVDMLIDQRVSTINMSFSGPPNELLEELVRRAAAEGVALVAAAGNGGPLADPAYPAAYPDVIAVTAVDIADRIYRQANQGDYISFAAPGVDLWTAASISGGRLRSGTSYAAPFVTAALAARRAEAPGEPLADSLALLTGNARDLGDVGPDEVFGHGVVQAGFLCG